LKTAPPLSATADSQGRILARGLMRRFGAKQALAGVDLDLGPGGVIGLLGPNGSGKSTLLRILTGLTQADAGEVWIDGVRLEADGLAVRQRCSYAPGEIALYGELSGARMLEFLLRGREPAAQARGIELCRRLELPLERRVRGWSHGMKRQLLFAAAMAPGVRVRILDEPTEGLDPKKRGEVLAILSEDAQSGTTILLSSHHLGETERVCERILFLHQGRKISDETRASVLERARRVLRVAFTSPPRSAELAALDGVLRARVDGMQASIEMESADPRRTLAALSSAPGLPAPIAIEHGSLSLTDLFREFYGVEAC
jgi:ABC-2 type transport system ATP-binding protein